MRLRPSRSDQGYTLIEVMIASALMLAVVAMVLPLVAGSLNNFTNSQTRVSAVDNAQLALGQISHDVVSSNILYIDNTGAVPVVHVQTYGKGAISTCAEYQVLYPASPAVQVGVLQRRTKAPGTGTAWSGGWGTIMTGVVNSSQTGAPSVFSILPSSQLQSLIVNLWVQLDTRPAGRAAAPENFSSTYTGPAIPANAAATATPSSEPC